jgi:predicted metal-binding membrane protein
MSGMDAGPGTDPGELGFYVGAWVVMMAAMMFPSISPTVVTYAVLHRRRRERRMLAPALAVPIFVVGYLLTWTLAGLAAYAIVKLARSLDMEALSWSEGGPYAAAGVLLAAAVYQLTPLKNVCLSHCRGPLTFLMEHWRDGRLGALRMGATHGAWCVGCCWLLMAALFALGVMSVAWMAVIAGFIALEKTLPWRRIANYGVAAALMALALGVAFAPEKVPALTLPDSEAAHMDHMQGMGGGSMNER